MRENFGRNPYMDYRNAVPFMDLSGFVFKQSDIIDETPAESLQQQLLKKRCSHMINLRRLQYRVKCEEYKNGKR